MYNPNSVIIQSMMGQQQYGGVQQISYTPPVPIGNIANITGAAGYNGGYYNGMYNNYYNPYMAAQQEEQRKAQEKELRRQQSEAMKALSRMAHAVDGEEISEERLNELYDYHPVEITKEDKEWMEIQRLAQQPPIDRSIYIQRQMAEAYSRANKFTRPDMTLEEFLEAGWDIMADIMTREQQEKERDLSTLYNKDKYSKLVNKSVGYNGHIFKGEVSIDDMSVFPTLSHKAKMEYAERRQRFMDAIFHPS